MLFLTFSKTKKTHLDVVAEQLHKELNPTKAIEYEEGYVLEQNEYDEPPPNPSLEPPSYNYAIFILHANPKLLKQITKDLLGDKLFRKVYGQLM